MTKRKNERVDGKTEKKNGEVGERGRGRESLCVCEGRATGKHGAVASIEYRYHGKPPQDGNSLSEIIRNLKNCIKKE